VFQGICGLTGVHIMAQFVIQVLAVGALGYPGKVISVVTTHTFVSSTVYSQSIFLIATVTGDNEYASICGCRCDKKDVAIK